MFVISISANGRKVFPFRLFPHRSFDFDDNGWVSNKNDTVHSIQTYIYQHLSRFLSSVRVDARTPVHSLSLSRSLTYLRFWRRNHLKFVHIVHKDVHAWKPATKDNNQLSAFYIFRFVSFFYIVSNSLLLFDLMEIFRQRRTRKFFTIWLFLWNGTHSHTHHRRTGSLSKWKMARRNFENITKRWKIAHIQWKNCWSQDNVRGWYIIHACLHSPNLLTWTFSKVFFFFEMRVTKKNIVQENRIDKIYIEISVRLNILTSVISHSMRFGLLWRRYQINSSHTKNDVYQIGNISFSLFFVMVSILVQLFTWR